jgi:hypothetical protein
VYLRRGFALGFGVPSRVLFGGWDVFCRLCTPSDWAGNGALPTSQENAIALGVDHLRARHTRDENGAWQ